MIPYFARDSRRAAPSPTRFLTLPLAIIRARGSLFTVSACCLVVCLAQTTFLVSRAQAQNEASQTPEERNLKAEEKFEGTTLVFDARRGENGEFLLGQRDISAHRRQLRVVILHPNGLKREYKRNYEKIEHHTSKFPTDVLSKFFAKSPTERSLIDPLETNRPSSSGADLASTSTRKYAFIGPPPNLTKAFTKYRDTFNALEKLTLVEPTDELVFIKATPEIRKALSTALQQGEDNADIRLKATDELVKVYNKPEYGFIPSPDNAFTPPKRVPIPLHVQGLKDSEKKLLENDGDMLKEDDYSTDGIKALQTFAGKLVGPARTATKDLETSLQAFLNASNKLAIAIQQYKNDQVSLSAAQSSVVENITTAKSSEAVLSALNNQKLFTPDEVRKVEAYLKNLDALKALTNAENKLTSNPNDAAAKVAQTAAVKVLQTELISILAEKVELVDSLQTRQQELTKVARYIAAQRGKYLATLADTFKNFADVYDALLDIDSLPTYEKGVALERVGGDAIDATVAVYESDNAPTLASSPALPTTDITEVLEEPKEEKAKAAATGASTTASTTAKKDADKEPLTKKTVTVRVYGRTVTDFTLGAYASTIRDRSFDTTPVGGISGGGRYVVTEGKRDDAGVGLAGLLHFYTTRRTGPAYGFAIGADLTNFDNYFAGPSIVFGSRNRVVLSFGGVLGKTTVLNNAKVGETISKASPDTSRRYDTGGFFSLSFALDIK